MDRTVTLTTLILISYCLMDVTIAQQGMSAHYRKPTKSTTKIPLPLISYDKTVAVDDNIRSEPSYYHPIVVQKPRLIERYDKRDLDGHYEYRYVLSNGDVRYERAYWQPVGNTKILARKGYYSYPLPNHRFHTVFYTADHNGFREDESSYTRSQPVLPRNLEIPMAKEKPTIEKRKDVKPKPIWKTAAATFSQKGLLKTIEQLALIKAIAKDKAKAAGLTETNTQTKRSLTTLETNPSSATYPPQINKKVEEIPYAKPMATSTTPTPSPTTTTNTATAAVLTGNESINPIKPKSVQTETLETETEQVEAVDTTTVLSMD